MSRKLSEKKGGKTCRRHDFCSAHTRIFLQFTRKYDANFLDLWVWEGTGAIQDDKYMKWQYLEGMTLIQKESNSFKTGGLVTFVHFSDDRQTHKHQPL